MNSINEVVASILEYVKDQPFLASLIISFISNSIPYMTVPYLILIAVLASQVPSLGGKILLAIGGGIGAGFGKLIVYLLGRGVHALLSQEAKENLDVFLKLFEKSMFVAIFLFAALPLPDDLLYVPLGVAGYSLKLYILAVILGKTLLTGLVVAFGSAIAKILAESLGGGYTAIASTVAIIAASIIISIIIVRMDWRKVAEAYASRGLLYGTLVMMVEGIRALNPYYKRGK